MTVDHEQAFERLADSWATFLVAYLGLLKAYDIAPGHGLAAFNTLTPVFGLAILTTIPADTQVPDGPAKHRLVEQALDRVLGEALRRSHALIDASDLIRAAKERANGQ